MPDFYVDDLNISPSDFVDACSKKEINELIEILIEDGYIDNESISTNNVTYDDELYGKVLIKLSKSRHRLTNEEEEIIKKIADKL
jgi:hypothetical protein